jgi:hypothetical protein
VALIGTEIKKALQDGIWTSNLPVEELWFEVNSLNVSLQPEILHVVPAKYDKLPIHGDAIAPGYFIDLQNEHSYRVDIYSCKDKFVLLPGHLYLAAIRERIDCSAPIELDQITPKSQYLFRPLLESTKFSQFFYPVIDGRV